MAKRKTYHVTQRPDGNWQVRGEGAAPASSTHSKEAEAVDRGGSTAKAQPRGQLVIHRRDGRIQTEHTYGKDPYPPKG